MYMRGNNFEASQDFSLKNFENSQCLEGRIRLNIGLPKGGNTTAAAQKML